MKKNQIIQADKLIKKAKQDLQAAEYLLQNENISTEIAGFHIQQSIEKILKSLLVINEVNFKKIHDLEILFDIIRENQLNLPEIFFELQNYTNFSVQFRYDFWIEVEGIDFEKGLKLTKELVKFVEQKLKES